MAAVELVLQGKGGVGKSYIAALLAQYAGGRGLKPLSIDTDPINATFSGFKAFAVERIELMNGDDVDPRAFDRLIEAVLGHSGDGPILVDNGAASFVPLCSYLIENDALAFLADAGHQVRFHTVLVGGQGLADTTEGLASLLKHFSRPPVVVWLNAYFGPVRQGEKAFEDSKLYAAHAERIHALITLPEVRRETFGRDLGEMLAKRLTFAEAVEDSAFSVMSRQRLKTCWRVIEDQLNRANLFADAGGTGGEDKDAKDKDHASPDEGDDR